VVPPTKADTVAPQQQGPTVASAVPEVKPPQINMAPWGKLSAADQATLSRAALNESHGATTGPALAAIWQRENGLKRDAGPDHADPHPDDPAMGPFQIHRKTWDTLDPGHTIDPHTLEGGATLAARYLGSISSDMGLPNNSPAAHLAYMAGETGAKNYIANNNFLPEHIGWLHDTFPGMSESEIKQSLLTSGSGNRVPADQRIAAAHNAALSDGPNGFMKSMIATGPTGIGMTQLWRNFQAAGEHYLILSGNLDGLPKLAEYVAQQSHMGAISNLYEADQALLKGDMQSAMRFIATSHAFVPDGATAELGLDRDGKLWATNFTDNGHNQVGQAFQITHEVLAQQLVRLSNPGNYVQTRQALEKQNAEINEIKAHGQYYEQRPAIEQAKLDAAEQRTRERIASQEKMAADRLAAQGEKGPAGAGADERNVRSQVSKDYGADYQPQGDEPAQPSPRQAEIDTALRRSPTYGGGGMSAPMARSTAHDVLRDPKDPKKLTLVPNKDGNGYSLVDKDGNKHGVLSTDMGDHIKGLAGTQQKPAQPKPQAAIGAGMNSPMLAMQGGQNLAGIVPQQQPQQPSAIG
jgi:hypothetical protein